MLPKLSAPLVKDIRTGEGIAEWIIGAGVAALSAVGDITVVKGVSTLTILAALKGVRRGLIKLVAVQKGLVGAPLPPTFLERKVSPVVDEVAKAVEAVATDPGTTDAAPVVTTAAAGTAAPAA